MKALSRSFIGDIRLIVEHARQKAYSAVNFAMVEAYWNIGRKIVEEEQKGKARAGYGLALLANLSLHLTAEFGKGFSEANLRNFRQFYSCFPIRYTPCSELGSRIIQLKQVKWQLQFGA